MHIEFVWDSRELEVWRNRGVDKALAKALRRAGNDAIRTMRAEGTRQVRDKKNIRLKTLREALTLKYPPNSSTIESLEWRMNVSDKAIPLGEFAKGQTRKGVRIEVNKGQSTILESSFKQMRKTSGGTFGSIKQGVYLRPTKERYPMGHLLGPNVGDVFEYERPLIPAVQEAGTVAFHKRFPYWFDKFLEGV